MRGVARENNARMQLQRVEW